ncbi:MAG: hypothetical protein J6U16_04840, partial [Ruminococcus sp.]|nr:hypothetical protein [Ruminococcus sp.]
MILAKLLVILMSFAVRVPAPHADIDYQGEIDIYTGEPAYSQEAAEQRVLRITDSCYYDTNERLFRYSVPESSECVYSNAADGMITDRVVSIRPDNGAAVSLYKNGNLVEQADFSEI